MGLSGLFVFVLVYAFLPETSHPGERGVDKVKSLSDEGAAALRSERPLRRFTKTLPIFINPLRPLALMRNPNLLFVCLAGFFVLQTGYTLLVPIAYTIGERYGISNEAIIGACILPSGLGTTIGAVISGRISDRIVVRMRAKRGGIWYLKTGCAPHYPLRFSLYLRLSGPADSSHPLSKITELV